MMAAAMPSSLAVSSVYGIVLVGMRQHQAVHQLITYLFVGEDVLWAPDSTLRTNSSNAVSACTSGLLREEC